MASKHVIEVNLSNFEKEVLKSDKVVMIDFFAEWCGPCKGMAPHLEKFAEENQDKVKVVKIDVDKNPELSQVFQITAMPTIVTMKGEQGLIKAVGALSKSGLEKMLDDSLQLLAGNNINNNGPKSSGPKP